MVCLMQTFTISRIVKLGMPMDVRENVLPSGDSPLRVCLQRIFNVAKFFWDCLWRGDDLFSKLGMRRKIFGVI